MEGSSGILQSREERRRTIDAQQVLPVLLTALVIAGGVAVGDVFLVRTARHHRSETAARVFERGVAARNAGKSAEALELFRRSLNENPSSAVYRLSFAEALRATGRKRESQVALERLLNEYPANGGANAEMARLLVEEGRWQDAAWFYHRALYGQWKEQPDLRTLRFELASLLAQHGAHDQLLAEVVLLTAEPLGPSESRKLGQLLLTAGDWARAERQYRQLLRTTPDDPYMLVGLARAQMGAGKYPEAERSFRRAVQAGGIDRAAENEMKVVTNVNYLDPNRRGIGRTEKHRRAHELTAWLTDVFRSCSAEDPLVKKATDSLARHERVRNPLEAAEADLDLFDELWQARGTICNGTAALPRELILIGDEIVK